jgi:Tfp pilus assembly protein PilN
MRPVNLIPPDERRGDGAPLRMGALVYVLTAGLAVLLLGIVAVALTSKQVSDREAEKASLEQELAQATAQAESVRAFTDFRAVQEARATTVSSLAQSRFDWNRVLNELALVLPSDIQLDTLTGTVGPNVQLGSTGQIGMRASVQGPALEIVGCAPNQDAVAAFVASLEDIDGVTRVGVSSSKLPDTAESSSAAGGAVVSGSSTDTQECQVGDIPKFEIVVAFDAVPTPSGATTTPSVPPAATPPTGSDQQQVAGTQTAQNVQRASVREQTSKARNSVDKYVPGG